MKTLSKDELVCSLSKLFIEKGRPLHLADFKEHYKVRTKRDSKKRASTESNRIARTLNHLFNEGRISKSRRLARVEDYPVSPYSKKKNPVVANVRFYAPVEHAGREIAFNLGGRSYELRFVDATMAEDVGAEPLKTGLVRELLMGSEKALTVNEVLDKLNAEHKLYDVSSKKKYYNATSSLTRAVLKKLMREGLRARMYDGRWVWYYTKEQLNAYQREYVEKDRILRTVEDLVKSHRCVPLNKVVAHLRLSPEDVRYKVKRAGKWVPVRIKVETTRSETKVGVEVGEYKRDGLVDWLGIVVPRSEHGYGYETMLVDLDSDWEIALKEQVRKSLSRINVKTLIGYFYEKLVARLFDLLCTSRELQRDPELSRYMMPFVFRSERVVNVWTTMDSGRRAEFDVLIRGTFKAFDTMAQGKGFLDIVIPIESKYTVVTAEHVTYFDDKIRKVFGDARNVMPIMVGLSWKDDAMTLARRFGFMPLYFSSLNHLIRALSGADYRISEEWRRVEEKLNQGELSLAELRKQVKSLKVKYLFEELIEERLGKKLVNKAFKDEDIASQKEETPPVPEEPVRVKPVLAAYAETIGDILSRHPMLSWEYKLDGIRVMAEKKDGEMRLISRNGRDISMRYPGILKEASRCVDSPDFLLDGELIALGDDDRSLPPQTLLRRNQNGHRLRYVVFDILRFDGEDLRECSYEERRQVLENRVKQNTMVRIVQRITSTNEAEVLEYYRNAKELGHEGLVAKSTSSPYNGGTRNTCWYKYKGRPDTMDLVVVGMNKGKGRRKGSLGSLLLAVRENGCFKTIGRVGTGFKAVEVRRLLPELEKHALREKPLNVKAHGEPDKWVAPEVVVEVSHEGMVKSRKYSSGYALKHSRYVRLREDKSAGEASPLLVTQT